jgi:glycosyltransferase involved in cell wall biosynthesis
LEDGNHEIQILCFGDQKEHSGNKIVEGIRPSFDFPSQHMRHEKLLDTLSRNIGMVRSVKETDIVHCHTWYAHLAGCLIKQMLDVPLVFTTHSLEPDRPWKEEQLGPAYGASTWLEKTAYQNADGVIAVSQSMKKRVHELFQVPSEKIRIIPNGIDINEYQPRSNPSLLASYRIKPDKPFLIFVGRITRQKGTIHLVNAIKYISPWIQIVLCAGAPDTGGIGREMEEKVKKTQTQTSNEILSGSANGSPSPTSLPFTAMPLPSSAHRCMNHLALSTWKPWHAGHRWSPLLSEEFQKSLWRVKRVSSFLLNPWAPVLRNQETRKNFLKI